MLVAVSSACFPELSFQETLDRLADLEYAAVEIVVSESDGPILVSNLAANFESILQACRVSRRITPIAIYLDLEPDHPKYAEAFTVCCRLAKIAKIVVITVRSSHRAAPFNGEIERLKELVKIGLNDGVIVGILTERGRITEEVDAVISLCGNVPGLAVTLDPSHFIFGHQKSKDYDALFEHVNHVRLRDTTPEAFQVPIGQGILEYGRLAIALSKVGYNRALCVDLAPLPNIEVIPELRKMRLFLESIL